MEFRSFVLYDVSCLQVDLMSGASLVIDGATMGVTGRTDIAWNRPLLGQRFKRTIWWWSRVFLRSYCMDTCITILYCASSKVSCEALIQWTCMHNRRKNLWWTYEIMSTTWHCSICAWSQIRALISSTVKHISVKHWHTFASSATACHRVKCCSVTFRFTAAFKIDLIRFVFICEMIILWTVDVHNQWTRKNKMTTDKVNTKLM